MPATAAVGDFTCTKPATAYTRIISPTTAAGGSRADRGSGHMGADAAGFLIIHNSSRNIFRRNLARLGGDGFFLAGLSPSFEPVPCNDNLFEENDGSWSPNIAFEATFSAGNIYRNNFANHCNYGFWLGFSSHGVLEDNQMIGNHQAGIAVENGFDFQVRRNLFQDNQHGILLWSKHIPEFLTAVPGNNTSYDWLIEQNEFIHNNHAIYVAANRDHGIRPYRVPDGETPSSWLRPHGHTVRKNRFQDNRVGVEAKYTDQTLLEDNSFEGSLKADFIEDRKDRRQHADWRFIPGGISSFETGRAPRANFELRPDGRKPGLVYV